ncbi:MAG: hypothetical protein WCJ64_23650 [Rhodospirillaceae bacterium]
MANYTMDDRPERVGLGRISAGLAGFAAFMAVFLAATYLGTGCWPII